jgi:hypothetical protein
VLHFEVNQILWALLSVSTVIALGAAAFDRRPVVA